MEIRNIKQNCDADKKDITKVTKLQESKQHKGISLKPLMILEQHFKIVKQFNDGTNKCKRQDIFICHHCGNKYPNKQCLNVHLKLHLPVSERKYVCEICAKRFVSARQLQIHMNIHTGNRPYKCIECKATFGDPSSCSNHKQSHSHIRPYKCNICEKAFKYSFCLKKHEKIHTGIEPLRRY